MCVPCELHSAAPSTTSELMLYYSGYLPSRSTATFVLKHVELEVASRERNNSNSSHMLRKQAQLTKTSRQVICKLKLRVVLQLTRNQPYVKVASSKTTCNLSCETPHNFKKAGKTTLLTTQSVNTLYCYLQHNNIFDPIFHQFFLWYKHFG